MDSPVFQYDRPLHEAAEVDTIRLIDLHPGTDSKPISCSLREVLLASAPDFAGISYSWGGQLPSEPIAVHGSTFNITPNLHRALRRFRKADQTVTLWADAICINQQDVEEKNHQVPMMGKIYSQASEVKVWIDPGAHEQDDTPRGAGACIQELKQLATRLMKQFNMPTSKLLDFESRTDWQDVRAACFELHRPDPKWEPLFRFVTNIWFSRVWIIQEVALSRERACLYYGETTRIWWDDIVTAMCFAMHMDALSVSMSDRGPETSAAVRRLVGLATTAGAIAQSEDGHVGLFWLLAMHRSANATDPRDKIYGLLGMARNHRSGDPDTVLVAADYHRDAASLYQQVTEEYLERFRSLAVLQFAGLRGDQNVPSLGLPSWVADWSDGLPHPAYMASDLDQRFESFIGGAYNAGRLDEYPKWYKVEGRVLKLKGVILDEIVEIDSIFQKGAHRASAFGVEDTIRAYLASESYAQTAELWGYSQDGDKYPPTDEDMLDAMIPTLCLGHVPPSLSNSVDARGMLRDLIKIGRASIKARTSAKSNQEIAEAMHRLDGNENGEVDFSWPEGHMSLLTRAFGAGNGFTPFRTRNDYIGLSTPVTTRAGDRIAMVQGSMSPLILRPADDDMWILVGEAYTHGIMAGQAFDIEKCHEVCII